MPSRKLPSNVFVNPSHKEKVSIHDYTAQYLDPISTLKEATRQRIFSTTKTSPKERLAEVIAVDNDVKLPSDLMYFSNSEISLEYGNRTFISVIARINDLDGMVPIPDTTIDPMQPTVTQTFKDLSRIRSHTGRFYASREDMAGKSVSSIEVGDWIVVEFQDKLNLQNGIIKEVYIKKNLATYTAPAGFGAGGLSGTGAFVAGGSYPIGAITPVDGDIIFIGGSMAPSWAVMAGKPPAGKGHGMQADGQGLSFLIPAVEAATPQPQTVKIVINIGTNDFYKSDRQRIQSLHNALVRTFPNAPVFLIARSPYHKNFYDYAPDRDSTKFEKTQKFYLTGGLFAGFSPPFLIFRQDTAMKAPDGDRDTHATSQSTDWQGYSEMKGMLERIMSSTVLDTEFDVPR